jgi:prepilin-type N-terminal cleavage/methylation domain-containing protein
MRTTQAGFTLLELILALLTVAVSAAIAIPVHFGRPEVTLENACVLLAHDLRAAQNRAAYLDQPTRFVFLPDGSGYRVTDLQGKVIRNPRDDWSFERIWLADGVFRGVLASEIDLGEETAIVYDGNGRALRGGSVRMRFGEALRVLHIAPRSGKISIEGSTSGYVDRGY